MGERVNLHATTSTGPAERRRSGKDVARAFATTLALAGALGACDEAPDGPTPGRPAFEGEAAMELVRRQVAFGPRVPGTEGHERQLEWMLARLDSLAPRVVADTFPHVTAAGDSLTLVNVIARFSPEASRRILFLAHWDSRPTSDEEADSTARALPVPGANDGASGTAVLLQLASIMAESPPPVGVDLLFVNTGGPPAGPALSFDDEAWRTAFELLVLSAVRMVRLAVPSMRARGGGAIVMSTSSAVKEPIPNLALSNVIRASVAAMSKTLANELAVDGIRVNHLMPGRINTDRVRHLDAIKSRNTGQSVEDVRAAFEKSVPLGRYGEPLEYGRAAAFLFSDAARYITGASLQVDGGLIKSAL